MLLSQHYLGKSPSPLPSPGGKGLTALRRRSRARGEDALRRHSRARGLRGILLAALLLGATGPLYLLLKVSVSPPAEVMTPHPTLAPHAVTWRHWQRLLD